MLDYATCATCAACSNVALLAATSVGDRLTVRSLTDQWVVETLAAAGLSVPTGPALLKVEESGRVDLHTGLRMRVSLARILGPTRARQALRRTASIRS